MIEMLSEVPGSVVNRTNVKDNCASVLRRSRADEVGSVTFNREIVKFRICHADMGYGIAKEKRPEDDAVIALGRVKVEGNLIPLVIDAAAAIQLVAVIQGS